MARLSLVQRLVLNCVGCGYEPATVALGPVDAPDETYGRRCWADGSRWPGTRPEHSHLDGDGCGPECEGQ